MCRSVGTSLRWAARSSTTKGIGRPETGGSNMFRGHRALFSIWDNEYYVVGKLYSYFYLLLQQQIPTVFYLKKLCR
jgi:hypothetical protein